MNLQTAKPVLLAAAVAIGWLASTPFSRTSEVQAIDCLDPNTPVQWNDSCKQVQNYWRQNGGEVLHYRYDPWGPVGPQPLGWKLVGHTWARIHEQFRKGPSAKQLIFYPERAARETTAGWDRSNGVSKLQFPESYPTRLTIYADEAHKYLKHGNTKNAHAATLRFNKKSKDKCGDGATARCFSSAKIYFNGGYGWLPTHDAAATVCCAMMGTHSHKRGAPLPPSHVVGWWGVSGIETTMMHEIGHGAGLQHASGENCPTYQQTLMKQRKAFGNTPSCSAPSPTSSDKIAMRYLFGHP